MTKKIRWGILGCGKIARKFATDLRLVEDAELVAIASHNPQKAQEFSHDFKPQLVFNDYESLASATVVDVIYVATPHGFHYEHVMLCLRHKKAVLCEKAFALNSKQLREMIQEARRQKVFLMEAFWTKFLPQYQKVMELIAAGVLGEIRLVQADFGFKAPEPKPQRLYDPVLGGGSLLDIGIYPVFLAQALLGKPTDIKALVTPYASHVDEQCVIAMKFEKDALAVISSTFAVDTPVEAMIAGTKGRIHLRNRFHNAMATVELIQERETVKTIQVHREEGGGYQFEARHVGECLRNNLIESPVMSYSDSLSLMDTLDKIRAQCGIRYAADE
ncbi:MAG: Gfo/Idh/MocA family protein [Bacteroidota bacterium]